MLMLLIGKSLHLEERNLLSMSLRNGNTSLVVISLLVLMIPRMMQLSRPPSLVGTMRILVANNLSNHSLRPNEPSPTENMQCICNTPMVVHHLPGQAPLAIGP